MHLLHNRVLPDLLAGDTHMRFGGFGGRSILEHVLHIALEADDDVGFLVLGEATGPWGGDVSIGVSGGGEPATAARTVFTGVCHVGVAGGVHGVGSVIERIGTAALGPGRVGEGFFAGGSEVGVDDAAQGLNTFRGDGISHFVFGFAIRHVSEGVVHDAAHGVGSLPGNAFLVGLRDGVQSEDGLWSGLIPGC